MSVRAREQSGCMAVRHLTQTTHCAGVDIIYIANAAHPGDAEIITILGVVCAAVCGIVGCEHTQALTLTGEVVILHQHRAGILLIGVSCIIVGHPIGMSGRRGCGMGGCQHPAATDKRHGSMQLGRANCVGIGHHTVIVGKVTDQALILLVILI